MQELLVIDSPGLGRDMTVVLLESPPIYSVHVSTQTHVVTHTLWPERIRGRQPLYNPVTSPSTQLNWTLTLRTTSRCCIKTSRA